MCRLIKNIKHSCEYNAGGVKEILLIDTIDFLGYKFENDGLFNSCYVENIARYSEPIVLDTINESNFIETLSNNVYTQQLTTFIRSLKAEKTSNLLKASNRKYIVVFVTYQNRAFTFGSDGGASISFGQISGQLGEAEGYNVTISKSSIYPLFEIRFPLKINVLGTEDYNILSTEEIQAMKI